MGGVAGWRGAVTTKKASTPGIIPGGWINNSAHCPILKVECPPQDITPSRIAGLMLQASDATRRPRIQVTEYKSLNRYRCWFDISAPENQQLRWRHSAASIPLNINTALSISLEDIFPDEQPKLEADLKVILMTETRAGFCVLILRPLPNLAYERIGVGFIGRGVYWAATLRAREEPFSFDYGSAYIE
ncbi:hypothetical protein B0H67DRAFT_684365 [Lasiosphaeris hirsuta]|uniref:Uncharacterized protein n=1 Tax=Lasiosphaeris hirsuta TaxID=260670 RepID=A0AA40AIC6_9PEZI|nr:hypothetical protein B0H67DRAFT_684365 [Lasiosphaeris hirsuta]